MKIEKGYTRKLSQRPRDVSICQLTAMRTGEETAQQKTQYGQPCGLEPSMYSMSFINLITPETNNGFNCNEPIR